MRNTPYRLSMHVATHEIGADRHAVWNRFFPSAVVVNQRTLDLLRLLPDSTAAFDRNTRRRLVRNRIVYRGASDPYEREFFDTADAALAAMDAEARKFYDDARPYEHLSLVNSGCNLGCSYCVSYAGDSYRTGGARVADKGQARQNAVLDVVDQFMRRHVTRHQPEAEISFNGGEILLRWPLVEQVLRHVRNKYPQVKTTYGMNTNATLIDDEVAASLREFGVRVHISIDGYKDLHDSSRVHHGGAPSFDRVMRGIAAYNRHNPGTEVKTFQGTIDDVGRFELSRFEEMAALGFSAARLAPNVLDAPTGTGVTAATWEAETLLNTQQGKIPLENSYLQKVLKKMRKRPAGFSPHCGGLSGNMKSVTLNIDSLQVSQMCSFVSPASVPLSELDCDIYDPRLWSKTMDYIRGRIEVLRSHCSGCNVLGVCQGACVYNGLDLANNVNPAACEYQRSIWRHGLELSVSGHIGQGGDSDARVSEDDSDHAVSGSAKSTIGGRTYIPLVPV